MSKKILTILFTAFLGIASLSLTSCSDDPIISSSDVVQTVKITFDSNGGEEIASMSGDVGASLTLPTPNRVGYTFEGWFEDEALLKAYTKNTYPNSNLTLYAKWKVIEKTTITFESNGGSTIEPKSGIPGENLQIPTPVYAGYNFLGWYVDATLKLKFTENVFPSSSMTLYAKWDAKYQNLEIIYNNGKPSIKKAIIESTNPNIETPILEGCNFAGWYMDSKFNVPFDNVMPSASATIYAKWEANAGTAFVSNDGVAQNPGTMLEPLDFDSALQRMRSNTDAAQRIHTIYLFGGTYDFPTRKIVDTNMGGTHNRRNIISGIDGDNLVVFNYSKQPSGERGFDIRANYVHMSNIIVERAGSYGIYVGGSHNIVENCVTRYNGNTGLGIARWDSSQNSLDTYPSDNLILKCTSHDNFDYKNFGEDADGFSAKLTAGHNNVFDSCIAFGNSDDGWDLYAKSSSGNTGITKIINCIAFKNGFLSDLEDENNDSPYNNGRTRDGDGNGFKLGGEVMYGNVYLENCLAFENGAHGYTDNSNPGILNLKNCTSYNNGLFDKDRYSNYNLARTESSMNVYDGILSIATNGQIGMDNEDEFRGPISNSIVLQAVSDKLQYNAIYDVMNGNSRIDELSGTVIDLNPETVFVETDISEFYQQNPESVNQIHYTLRNMDGSINLKEYLKIKDSTILTFNQGNPIGGNLSKNSMEEYYHHTNENIPQDADADTILAYEIYNQLFLMCNENAVYEDLDLYKKIMGNPITWTSSNPDIIKVDIENANPKDVLKGTDTYYWGKVVNPNNDTKVKLTATITIGETTLNKEFNVIIKALQPVIGEIEGLEDATIYQGEEYNPEIIVYDLNGREKTDTIANDLLDTNVKISLSVYNQLIEVDKLDTRIPGTYYLEYTIKIKGTGQQKVKTMKLEVVNLAYPVEIKSLTALAAGGATVEVNWPDGIAHVIAVSKGSKAPSAYDVVAGVDYTVGEETISVKDATTQPVDSTKFTFTMSQAQYGDYTYYVVVQNENGLSNVMSVDAVVPTYVSTAQELYDVMHRNVSDAEYIALKNDIDLLGFDWDMKEVVFSGVFDGKGHTISNLTINYEGTTYAGLFYETQGAIIRNLNISEVNISAPSSTGASAVIGKANDTTLENIRVENINITGTEGIGGIIGQTATGNIYMNKVSVINTKSDYLINATKRYAGGLIGCFMGGPTDDAYNEVVISNAEVTVNIKCGSSGYAGGFVGRVKGNENRYLKVRNGIYRGTLFGKYAGTTTGGSDKNVLGCKMEFINIVSFAKIDRNDAGNGIMNGRIQSSTAVGLINTLNYWVELSDGSNAKPSKVLKSGCTIILDTNLNKEFYEELFDLDTIWGYNEEKNIVFLK